MTSIKRDLPGRLFHILLKSPIKNTNFSPTYADDLQRLKLRFIGLVKALPMGSAFFLSI